MKPQSRRRGSHRRSPRHSPKSSDSILYLSQNDDSISDISYRNDDMVSIGSRVLSQRQQERNEELGVDEQEVVDRIGSGVERSITQSETAVSSSKADKSGNPPKSRPSVLFDANLFNIQSIFFSDKNKECCESETAENVDQAIVEPNNSIQESAWAPVASWLQTVFIDTFNAKTGCVVDDISEISISSSIMNPKEHGLQYNEGDYSARVPLVIGFPSDFKPSPPTIENTFLGIPLPISWLGSMSNTVGETGTAERSASNTLLKLGRALIRPAVKQITGMLSLRETPPSILGETGEDQPDSQNKECKSSDVNNAIDEQSKSPSERAKSHHGTARRPHRRHTLSEEEHRRKPALERQRSRHSVMSKRSRFRSAENRQPLAADESSSSHSDRLFQRERSKSRERQVTRPRTSNGEPGSRRFSYGRQTSRQSIASKSSRIRHATDFDESSSSEENCSPKQGRSDLRRRSQSEDLEQKRRGREYVRQESRRSMMAKRSRASQRRPSYRRQSSNNDLRSSYRRQSSSQSLVSRQPLDSTSRRLSYRRQSSSRSLLSRRTSTPKHRRSFAKISSGERYSFRQQSRRSLLSAGSESSPASLRQDARDTVDRDTRQFVRRSSRSIMTAEAQRGGHKGEDLARVDNRDTSGDSVSRSPSERQYSSIGVDHKLSTFRRQRSIQSCLA